MSVLSIYSLYSVYIVCTQYIVSVLSIDCLYSGCISYYSRTDGTLNDVLRPYLVNSDAEDKVTIVVQRHQLWKSLMRALSSSWFKYYAVPLIQFSGEDAEDAGGPRREFFRYIHIIVFTCTPLTDLL